MIRTKTVFIVGAGASCELNFPSGSKLLEQLSHTLDIRFDGWDMKSGDRRVFGAFEEIVRKPTGHQGDANPLLHASWKIRDAAHLGLSIDNVIHQLDDDPLVSVCGKIGIARQLLSAEQSSLLRAKKDREQSPSLSAIRPTWLGRFAQLLSQDMQRNDLERLFENVSVISFNYDRSIRQFLPFALTSQFAIDELTAQTLSKKLKIFHPYGSLGALPWEAPHLQGVGYGEADTASLPIVARSLRTFTERFENSGELTEMRLALSEAERIVFLGFGYHRQNMELLTNGVTPNAARVYGTSMGLSNSDVEVVSGQLSFFYREPYRGHHKPTLLPMTCVEFIDEHFRTFVS